MDGAKKIRQEFLRSIPEPVTPTPLRKAIQYLGTKWILHPQYDPKKNKHHQRPGSSVLSGIFEKARKEGRL